MPRSWRGADDAAPGAAGSAAAAGAGDGQAGGQAGLNTLITQVYPPRMRSTALGWAGGAGRIGGVLAPLYGGLAIAQHYSLQLTLGLAALLPFTVAVLISFLGIASAKRHSEVAAKPAAV